MALKLLIVVLCALTSTECANILFFTVTPSHSHQVMFQPIWKELSLRGHKVVAVTTNPLNEPQLTNLTEVDVSTIYSWLKTIKPENSAYLIKKPDFLTVFLKDAIMTGMWSYLNSMILNHTNVQQFLKQNHQFDVVITEWLFPTFAALGPYFKAPLIGITSLGAPIPALDTVGNPSHPVYAPDHNLPVSRDMPFRERLMSGLWAIYVRTYYHMVVLPREDKMVRQYLGDDLPYLGEAERNVSLLLLNRNPVFHRIMPVVPAVIELGYIKRNITVEKLSPDLQEYLDNSKQGAIYFSLGTNLYPENMPENTISAIFKAFSLVPYNVVFKWKGDRKEVPKNVRLVDWLPQKAVLAHKNIKLFVMQGGLQSSEEAILNKVPIIGIPFVHDQTSNVDTMVKYGMGELIEFEDITAEKLSLLIEKLMTHSKYKENASKLAELYVDQPQDGLQKAVWWIEYVIRHKGAKHLRSTVLDLPWYQYLMLDIIACLCTVLTVVLLLVYLVAKLLFKLLRKILGNKIKKD